MNGQPEQLELLARPSQQASYIQLQDVVGVRYTHEISQRVTMSAPAVAYLADAALRDALHEQLKADPRWGIVPIVGHDGVVRTINRVPRKSLVESLSKNN